MSINYDARRERIEELLKDEKLSMYDLCSILLEEFGGTRDAHRKAVKRAKTTVHVKFATEGDGYVKDSVAMNFETRQYEFVFSTTHGVSAPKIDFDEIQEYVRWYVYEGLGWNRSKVSREAHTRFRTKLSSDFVRRIFRAIDVTKTSSPIAPHMFQEVDDDEVLAATWREQREANLEARFRSGEVRHLKQIVNKLQKKLADRNFFITEAIDMAEFSGLPPYELPVLHASPYITEDLSEIDVLLGDWHCGLNVDTDYNVFNSEILALRIEEFLDKLADFMNKNGGRIGKVNIWGIGDMIDGPQGDAHPQQYMEQELHGVAQCVTAADAYAGAVVGVASICGDKTGKVLNVPGNHGRARQHHSEDPERLPETLMYHIAKAKVDHVIQLDWTIASDLDVYVELERGDRIFIAGHGDRTPRNPERVAIPRLRRGKQVVFYNGHFHQVKTTGLYDANFIQIQNGTIAGSTPYAFDRLGYHNNPAQLIVEIVPGNELALHPVTLTQHGCPY